MSIHPLIPIIELFLNWPSKSKVKVIAQGHIVGITSYPLISLSSHVDQPSHSWDTAISKFDLDNSRSSSCVMSKFKIKMWVWHPIDSHPFGLMSIGSPIPEIQHFQNLTLNIQSGGLSSRPQSRYNNLSTHIPFVLCRSTLQLLG